MLKYRAYPLRSSAMVFSYLLQHLKHSRLGALRCLSCTRGQSWKQHPLVLWTLQAWGCGMPFWPKCCKCWWFWHCWWWWFHKTTSGQTHQIQVSTDQRLDAFLGRFALSVNFLQLKQCYLNEVWGQQPKEMLRPRSSVTKEYSSIYRLDKALWCICLYVLQTP